MAAWLACVGMEMVTTYPTAVLNMTKWSGNTIVHLNCDPQSCQFLWTMYELVDIYLYEMINNLSRNTFILTALNFTCGQYPMINSQLLYNRSMININRKFSLFYDFVRGYTFGSVHTSVHPSVLGFKYEKVITQFTSNFGYTLITSFHRNDSIWGPAGPISAL